MNLQINKIALIAVLSTLSLLSCTTESEGDVKSIEESFPTTSTAEADPNNGKFQPIIKSTNDIIKVDLLFEGGEEFKWSFPGGTPDSSTQEKPGLIEYSAPGEYTISLNVIVDNQEYDHSETITLE